MAECRKISNILPVMFLTATMAPETVFLEVARKLLEFNRPREARPAHISRLEQRTAWPGSGAPAPNGVQGQRPGNFLTSLPIFEHGLQFRFNEITYFLEHYFIG